MFVFSICQIFWTPKVYSGTVLFEVYRDSPHLTATGSTEQTIEPGRDVRFMTTQFKLVESYSILSNVITTLHLDKRLAAQTGAAHWTKDQTYAALFDQISVEQTRMTSLIKISVRNRDPKLAADIANAMVDSYRDLRNEMRMSREYGGFAPLEAQLSEDKTKLAKLEMLREHQLADKNLPYFELQQSIAELKEKINELTQEIVRGMAEVGMTINPVIVRDPARPVFRPVNSNSAVFLRWMTVGTLAALMAGGAAAWLSYLSRRPFHGPSTPT